MRNFPTELVDLVIDKLVEPSGPGEPYLFISNYSTISRQWLNGTQKHHFNTIHFSGVSGIERWRKVIAPDPSGVSRHVRKISWRGVDTLHDFDELLRAFTRVVHVLVMDCKFFKSSSELAFLAPLGSSLERLEIKWMSGEVEPLANFLAGLPHLRQLCVEKLTFSRRDTDLPIIPFFEGANSLDLLLRGGFSPGDTDWIPPTARFYDLRIDTACIKNNHGLVNQWLRSSAGSLERFTINDGELAYYIDSLDLSACTSLRFLQFPVPLDQPQVYAKFILPLVSSSQLCRVILRVRGRKRDVSGSWEEMDGHLTRLAKQFKKVNGGKKMEVWAIICKHYGEPAFEWLENEWPMPNVKKEATVAVQSWACNGLLS